MNFIGMQDLIGKTITGIVYKESNENPSSQLILVLSDGRWFEFYTVRGARIIPTHSSTAGGLEGARKYSTPPLEIIFETYLDDNRIVWHDRQNDPA